MSHDADDLQPTIVLDSATTASASSTAADVSQWRVGVVAGARPRLVDETARLVRQRLLAASLLLSGILGFTFLRGLYFQEYSLIVLRAAILVTMIASFCLLRGPLDLSLKQLHLFELIVFGGLILQIGGMMWVLLPRYAAGGEAGTVIACQTLYLAGFALVIMIYGMFMPNRWQRAAAILLPTAAVPYLILLVLRLSDENVARAISADVLPAPVPLPLLAAVAAIYGSHIINVIRREAFKARQLGQYRLKEKLGAGGMGEVYRAEHMLLKRPCAIKLIREGQGANATALARFEREVQATARLTHWNSVEIFDYGHTDDGVFYYVMELLPGKSLEDLVQDHGPMPPERVVHFLRETCHALREAHHMGLIHRDLKPANIFAAYRGGIHDVTKLLDFGLVRQVDADPQGAQLTQVGSFSGSPLYMPPEQAVSYSEVDGRGDIYSLGAVAYYLLTGQPPFVGDRPLEIIMAHARDEVVPPSRIQPQVPTDLEQIVLRCLRKRPQDRFPDVESLEVALSQCQCANQWSEQQAARWWKENQPRAGQSS